MATKKDNAPTHFLYVYGVFYDRGGDESVRLRIDPTLIERALSFTDENRDTEGSDWLETDEVNALPFALQYGLLMPLVMDECTYVPVKKQWEETGEFAVDVEEFTLGVSKTKDGAKLQHASIHNPDDDDEWE